MPGQQTILIVDDDADVRICLAEALEDEGYCVAVAANGREALQLLQEEGLRPDVILLDLMMPELDGWGFRREQRRSADLADIPVIVLTAYGPSRESAAELQAAGLLKKPVGLDDLLGAIEIVLRDRG
jgi:two-component system response regulator MprA